MLAQKIGKSAKAIRGVVYNSYKTEVLDKVRLMIGTGQWGDNVPVPTVNQNKRKSDTKNTLSLLAGLLVLRRNDLGWSDFWQKDMCMHWDNVKGCIKEQKSCDECADFLRIKPQYCVRCGKTFFERQANKVCFNCRQARKKQAARKYFKLNKEKD